MLAERAKRWTEEWLQEGIERGKAQGIEQGKAQGIEQGKAQGIEQGIERERALLSRLTARRFGDRAGERLATYLAGVNDPARLESVADLIVECASGGELIDCVNALFNPRPG